MGNDLKKRGRPKGMRSAQLELQKTLYEHPDRSKVIETVYRAALDHDHKHQAAAMKLIMDRTLPISFCDRNADVRQQINITISGVDIPKEKVIN